MVPWPSTSGDVTTDSPQTLHPASSRLSVLMRMGGKHTLQSPKIRVANPPGRRVSENTAFGFYYAIYYAILFFTTLFTTLREAPANDLYVFWHVPKRQYGCMYVCMHACMYVCMDGWMYVCVYIYIYIYINMSISLSLSIYIYMYIYIYIYM